MNTILKLGPPVHWSLGDAAGAVLSNNVTLRKNDAPYIHLCYIANERLLCVEASSKCVLILPYHGVTPGGNRAAFIQTCTTGYVHTILVEFIVSVGTAPCNADVVPFSIVNSNFSDPFEKEEIF